MRTQNTLEYELQERESRQHIRIDDLDKITPSFLLMQVKALIEHEKESFLVDNKKIMRILEIFSKIYFRDERNPREKPVGPPRFLFEGEQFDFATDVTGLYSAEAQEIQKLCNENLPKNVLCALNTKMSETHRELGLNFS